MAWWPRSANWITLQTTLFFPEFSWPRSALQGGQAWGDRALGPGEELAGPAALGQPCGRRAGPGRPSRGGGVGAGAPQPGEAGVLRLAPQSGLGPSPEAPRRAALPFPLPRGHPPPTGSGGDPVPGSPDPGGALAVGWGLAGPRLPSPPTRRQKPPPACAGRGGAGGGGDPSLRRPRVFSSPPRLLSAARLWGAARPTPRAGDRRPAPPRARRPKV